MVSDDMYPRNRLIESSQLIFLQFITIKKPSVVKTRLQMIPKPGDFVYKNMAHCYRHIIRTEGVSALFKGVVPRMLIVSPLFAITVLVYELQQRFLSAHPI